MAIASLVLGILWIWWVGSVLALIFGYIGKNQIDQSAGTQTGRGMAVAGIVLGWIGVGTRARIRRCRFARCLSATPIREEAICDRSPSTSTAISARWRSRTKRRCARRGASRPAEELELFARSLASDDQVALEATGPALQIKRVLEPHVGRVAIANTRKLRAIAEARVKTDKLDARTLCELLGAGFLPEVFGPDEETRALRRRLGRRAALVRQRTRAKNEIHAVLSRNLEGKPPMSDVFGVRGREWLEGLPLPADERETVAGCLRQVDFLDREIEAAERSLARSALASAEIRRLMTVPGVNLVSAATFVATLGDVGRFETPRKLVSYVGLDPKVRQSGEAPARHGHISKRGSAAARHMLCEAAWIVVRTPGPLRAFYERVRARRGAQIALVATTRKLCVLGWHLLTREEDYAFGRPSLTRHKLRRLELIAGDPSHRGRRSGSAASKREQAHERELSEQFERAYRRLVADWRPKLKKEGAGATRGRAS